MQKEHATCCKIQGCQGKGQKNSNGTEVFSLGYCIKHYTRLKTHGDPLIIKHIRGEERKKNPLYKTYIEIKNRCYNEKNYAYKDYGGRRIIMSDEWLGLHGFSQFILDMGERPEGYTIDRIDVNGNYTKENCRWANNHQQAANMRTNNKKVGVSWCKKSNKWQAQITINRKSIYLGYFVNYEDACKARRDAEILHNVYDEKKDLHVN